MSDAIDRQAAIEAVGYYSLHSGDKLLFADKPLKQLPSVQPEIIRCKDCTYYDKDYSDELSDWCHVWSETTRYDGYCHEAEPYKGEQE